MNELKVIKYYPYRTAMVRRGVEFPRELMRSLEEFLNKEAGVAIDNHVCFSVLGEHGTTGAIMFHDLVCVIGSEIEERRW